MTDSHQFNGDGMMMGLHCLRASGHFANLYWLFRMILFGKHNGEPLIM